MTRLIKILLVAGLLAGLARTAPAFSLLGQFKTWQVSALGYQLEGDIGGPQLGNEGYRWNIPTIYYAFDSSFISYFGKPGMAAIDAMVQVFNELPAFSAITNDGSRFYIGGEEVPFDVRAQNPSFSALGLIDLKSQALQLMVEEMGLAEPSRYVWTLRGRNVDNAANPPITNYSVVNLNYDPITFRPTPYINGRLANYTIEDPIMTRGVTYADALEVSNDQPDPYFGAAVADRFLPRGTWFLGLSHDDLGGLKFLYNRYNFAVETLVTGVVGGTAVSSSPWGIYVGTNFVTTNAFSTNVAGTFIATGVRPGVNKIRFKKVKYDSLFSQLFVPVTNSYSDTVLSNSRAVRQSLSRGLTQPDLLFVAEDLGLVDNYVPFHASRTATAAWQNNDVINGNDGVGGAPFGGPGVISPQVTITFSDQLPYWINSFPDFVTGGIDRRASAVWASFDENTDEPIIYPLYLNLTLQDIERLGR